MRRGDALVLHAADHDGKPWSLERIDMDDYREMVRLVGGNLGMCSLPPSLKQLGFFAYCDDDALIKDNPPAPNGFALHLGHFRLAGPVVIVRAEGELEIGLDEADVDFWTDYLIGPPSDDARQMAWNEYRFWKAHPTGFAVASVGSIEEFFDMVSQNTPGDPL